MLKELVDTELGDALLDNNEIKMTDFYSESIDDIDEFDANSMAKGEGYKLPHFPIIEEKLEGLDEGLYLFAGESNGGKALALNTPILLSNGIWTTIGDIKVGAKVWGDNGKPTTVVCKSKLFTDHKCYNITFDDDSVFTADMDHLWKVYEYHAHKENRRVCIMKTKDMFADFKHVNPDGYPKYKYRIPMQKAIEYSIKKLPLDPYILGVWLGDGDSAGNRITVCKNDYETEKNTIESKGITVGEFQKDGRDNNAGCFRLGEIEYDGFSKGYNKILDSLRDLNLIGNKHIPSIYLHGSIEQRMELLRGLMDTDGTSNEGGLCEFAQKKSSKINESFGELLSSLGIKWSKSDKTIIDGDKTFYAIRYYFACSKDYPCFYFERKINNLRNKLADRTIKYKTIVNIEEVDTVHTQCIEVNNESHCFCVGKNLTVTHNTAMMMNLLWDACTCEENKLYGLYISLDDSTQDVYPRIIAMDQQVPIGICAKPLRYQKKIDAGEEGSASYVEGLAKRAAGIKHLKELNEHFKLIGGNKLKNGEQIKDFIRKVQRFVKSHEKGKDIIVAIDSLNDIRFGEQKTNTTKDLHDFIAKEVKSWATEFNIPIFGSCHLRKLNSAKGGSRRPGVEDLKESSEYHYEASVVFLINNDVSKNKQSANIFWQTDDSDERKPVIELDWAKNKKSSFKGRTYNYFIAEQSRATECTKDSAERYDALIYQT